MGEEGKWKSLEKKELKMKLKALRHQEFLDGLTSLCWIPYVWRMPRLSGTWNVGTVKYGFCNDSELLPASPHAGAFTQLRSHRTALEMEKVKETGWVHSVPSTECSM